MQKKDADLDPDVMGIFAAVLVRRVITHKHESDGSTEHCNAERDEKDLLGCRARSLVVVL